jgi:hypothetical protein
MSTLRFGKHPPKHDYRTLRLRNYLSPELSPPPPSFDVLADVYKKLKVSDPSELFPMDGNDQYGDCTIAALAHATTVYAGKVGDKKIPPQGLVEKTYLHLTGGVDSGLQELDVLNYWRTHAVGGEKILAYVKLDERNHDTVKQAIRLFGGVYLGFQVQKGCEQEFEQHKPWTPAPLTPHGHAVYAVAYDAKGVTVLTWGNTQLATWGWWDHCVDEAYAILPPQAKASDFDPGFNFKQLQADLKDVAHD